jgi:hypothetical protein
MTSDLVNATVEFPNESPEPTQPIGSLPSGDSDQSTPSICPRFECRLDEIWVNGPCESHAPHEPAGGFPYTERDQPMPQVSPSFECDAEEIWIDVPDESRE